MRCFDSTEPSPTNVLWVGDHQHADTASAFEYCLRVASQVSLRRDVDDLLARPVSDISHAIYAATTGLVNLEIRLDQLSHLLGDAKLLMLRGNLCSPNRNLTSIRRVASHQWAQVIPAWLMKERESIRDTPVSSIAVLSSELGHAEPVLELAASHHVAAVWFRDLGSLSCRCFDAVWWDDSVAGPVSSRDWQTRIESWRDATCHLWVVGAPSPQQVLEAKRGGIGKVISKPYQLDYVTDCLGLAYNQRRKNHALVAAA